MAVQLKPEQEQRLQQLASQSGMTADELLQREVDSFLDYQDDLAMAVREGEESAARDGWLTHEEVFEHLNSLLLKSA
jgi:predicted transcriptional regulator